MRLRLSGLGFAAVMDESYLAELLRFCWRAFIREGHS
ncbi:unnamed protein product [Rhodiola kirilowii]